MQLTIGKEWQDAEEGNAGAGSLARLLDDGIDARPEHASREDRLIHAIIVAVEEANRRALRSCERGRAILLGHRNRLTIELALDHREGEVHIRSALIKRTRIGQCPGSNTIVNGTREVERAQEVLGAVILQPQRDARGLSRRLDREGQAAEWHQRLRCIDMNNARGERRPGIAGGLNKRSLRDGVDLSAVEAISKPELIGGDEEAVGIGADERLVTQTWTVGMTGSAVAAVIGGIDGERSPGARRVRSLADRDQCMRRSLECAICRINTDV